MRGSKTWVLAFITGIGHGLMDQSCDRTLTSLAKNKCTIISELVVDKPLPPRLGHDYNCNLNVPKNRICLAC